MKRFNVLTIVLALVAVPVFGQEDNSGSSGGADLLRELWSMDDATTLAPGQVDLRLTFGWTTASAPANLGDSNDDFVFTPSLTWGAVENLEIFAEVPVFVGDGGDRPALGDGNADTVLGFTLRFMEPDGTMPAAALQMKARVPTGDNSNGVDGEARLILTNEYDSGLRSHINAFAQSINGDIDEELREFQWGFVVGMDGPLCLDGAVRWVADYLHRVGLHNGTSNMHILELGWEWDMGNTQRLGFATQIGLDQVDDTPNFGAAITYAQALTF
jgi:hypothetical protein